MFVWKEKRYLYSEGTVGASLNETRSAYKSEKQTSVEDLLQKKKKGALRILDKGTLSQRSIFWWKCYSV